jgi:hypothetical protein
VLCKWKEICKGGLKFDSHPDLLVLHACGMCGCTWGYSGSGRVSTPCHVSTRTASCRFPQYKKIKKGTESLLLGGTSLVDSHLVSPLKNKFYVMFSMLISIMYIFDLNVVVLLNWFHSRFLTCCWNLPSWGGRDAFKAQVGP